MFFVLKNDKIGPISVIITIFLLLAQRRCDWVGGNDQEFCMIFTGFAYCGLQPI